MSHYGYVELSPFTCLCLFWLLCSLCDVETAVNYVTITKMADRHKWTGYVQLAHSLSFVCTYEPKSNFCI